MKKNNINFNSCRMQSFLRKANYRWVIILFCSLINHWSLASGLKKPIEITEKVSLNQEVVFIKDSLIANDIIFVSKNTILFSSDSLIVRFKKVENKNITSTFSSTKKNIKFLRLRTTKN